MSGTKSVRWVPVAKRKVPQPLPDAADDPYQSEIAPGGWGSEPPENHKLTSSATGTRDQFLRQSLRPAFLTSNRNPKGN